MSELVEIAGVPVRITSAITQPMYQAIDVLRFASLDLELSVVSMTGSSSVTVELITGMSRETEAGWVTATTFAPATAAQTFERKTVIGLLRFVRWRVATMSGDAAFTLSGYGRRLRPSPFTPAELGGLTLWLDEHDQVAVSGAYSDWGDQSPSGANDFTQGTAGLRPSSGTYINSLPAPYFKEAATQFLGGNALSTIVGSQAYHGFVILRATSVSGNNATAYFNNGVIADTGAGWWGLFLKNNGGTLEAHAFHWDSTLRDATAAGLILGSDTLIEWSYDGSTVRCRIGTGTTASAVASGSIGLLTQLVRIGNGPPGSLYYDGAIASVLVFSKHLSDIDVFQVRRYLSTRYGVAV